MKLPRYTGAFALITGTLLAGNAATAQTVSVNSGSLGAAGNGTNTAEVTLEVAGAIAAGGDLANFYSDGARTTIPFNPALNPALANAPFTIEFWAKPAAVTDDNVGPSPLFNRVSDGNRSGWVFFQRSPTTGWNFRMYNGNGDQTGFSITGGTNAADTWSHVVVVWNGIVPVLYVNGVEAAAGSPGGVYLPSTTATFSIGSYDTGNNPFNGALDETAFYGTALTGQQILAHYNAASSTTPGLYQSLVLSDGAVLYLQNIPEPATGAMLAVGLAGFAGMRRKRRQN